MPDIIVKNQAELDAALRAATGGETIKLLAGTYTSVSLNGRNFASNVTITSADATNPATVQRTSVLNSSNVTFRNLELGRQVAATEPDYTQLHNVTGSTNITFDSVHVFGGSGDPSKSLGWGIFLRDSTNVTVKNSTIDHVAMGLQITGVNNLILKDNTFENNRRDGVNLGAVTNVVIDGNLFTDMFPVNGEHPDAIQFLTNGTTTASSNIVIKNNIIMQGAGEPIQGIFMGEEVGTLPYSNVDITNNLIYLNGMSNGISIGHANNVNIQSNTIVSRTDDNVAAWISLGKVNGAMIAGNIGDRLVIDSSATNIVQGNNSWLQRDSVMLRKFADLNALGAATLAGMIVDDLGYHPPVGSAAAAIVAAETAAAKPSPTRNLLLDIEFKPAGLVEQSRFNSSRTSAIDLSSILNGTYHVQTGKGFEVTRSSSVQLFALPAFTLSFSMQRDSATATAGQIVGVFQSWSVSLQANGELNFTIKNAAGTSYSVVTQGANLTDTKSHKIGVTYDSAAGRAVIYVDNVAKGAGLVTGSTRALENWGLYVGSQFGTAFSGRISNIEMRDQALSAAQITTLSTASDFGVTRSVSFAGLMGQIVSGTGSSGSSNIVAMADRAVAANDAVTGSVAGDIASLSAGAARAEARALGSAPLALSGLAAAKRYAVDMFHS